MSQPVVGTAAEKVPKEAPEARKQRLVANAMAKIDKHDAPIFASCAEDVEACKTARPFLMRDENALIRGSLLENTLNRAGLLRVLRACDVESATADCLLAEQVILLRVLRQMVAPAVRHLLTDKRRTLHGRDAEFGVASFHTRRPLKNVQQEIGAAVARAQSCLPKMRK